MIVLSPTIAVLLVKALGVPCRAPAPRSLKALMDCGLVRNMVRSACR